MKANIEATVTNTDPDNDLNKINHILTHGVEDVLIEESLSAKLASGRVLRVKFGIDPTGPTIHLGRTIPLLKLREFQDMGHQVVLVVGDFTAQIGDPSDKLEKRPMITPEIIKENLLNYKTILGKIINIDKAEFVFNSTWLSKLGFQEISNLAESFSVSQMTNRRNFKDRLDRGEEVSLREFLYPLMQGYDSVAVKADIEIGGTDQLFNLMAGRAVQKHYGQPEQDIVTTSMLEGTDGRKMSTSWGNVITITDSPDEIFGKIMSLRDDLIGKYFYLCTKRPTTEIDRLVIEMETDQVNPRDVKMDLARTLVATYYNEEEAQKAQENFISLFQKKEIPDDIIEIALADDSDIATTMVLSGVVTSKTDWRRLLSNNSITNMQTDQKVNNENEIVSGSYRIGKRRFVRIVKE